MTDPFTACLDVVLAQEGGFVNNSRDPGGITCLGVTQATWEDWTGKPATEAIMKALTPAKVAPLYAHRYWKANRCDDLPPAVALCVFDMGVNAGPERAAKMLQQVLGVAQDGLIGQRTINAALSTPVAQIVRQYADARRTYYRNLNTFSVFGRGWLARVQAVETAALRMIP